MLSALIKITRSSILYRVFCFFFCFLFVFSGLPAFAQPFDPAQGRVLPYMPPPGQMITPATKPFDLPYIVGMRFSSDNIFEFTFILNRGDVEAKDQVLRQEVNKVGKYFLAALTIPEKDIWVNLSPYEKDRIITSELGQTDMGKDLLGEDYVLKQLASSLTHPDSASGKQFWSSIYKQAQEKLGTTKIPVNTFNKVWIVPGTIKMQEANDRVVINQAGLKVLTDEDYLATQKNGVGANDHSPVTQDAINRVSTSAMREVIVPLIEKEVNTGKHFAHLRQVYYSIIMAGWFKKKLKDTILNQIYFDQKKVKGAEVNDPALKDKIYKEYVTAFNQGVYKLIRREKDAANPFKTAKREYFSGGSVLGPAEATVPEPATPVVVNTATAKAATNRVGASPCEARVSLSSIGQTGAESQVQQQTPAAATANALDKQVAAIAKNAPAIVEVSGAESTKRYQATNAEGAKTNANWAKAQFTSDAEKAAATQGQWVSPTKNDKKKRGVTEVLADKPYIGRDAQGNIFMDLFTVPYSAKTQNLKDMDAVGLGDAVVVAQGLAGDGVELAVAREAVKAALGKIQAKQSLDPVRDALTIRIGKQMHDLWSQHARDNAGPQGVSAYDQGMIDTDFAKLEGWLQELDINFVDIVLEQLERAETDAAAEKLLGPLTKAQKDAIWKAHKIGNGNIGQPDEDGKYRHGSYSATDIETKKTALAEAGFTGVNPDGTIERGSDIDKLMRGDGTNPPATGNKAPAMAPADIDKAVAATVKSLRNQKFFVRNPEYGQRDRSPTSAFAGNRFTQVLENQLKELGLTNRAQRTPVLKELRALLSYKEVPSPRGRDEVPDDTDTYQIVVNAAAVKARQATATGTPVTADAFKAELDKDIQDAVGFKAAKTYESISFNALVPDKIANLTKGWTITEISDMEDYYAAREAEIAKSLAREEQALAVATSLGNREDINLAGNRIADLQEEKRTTYVVRYELNKLRNKAQHDNIIKALKVLGWKSMSVPLVEAINEAHRSGTAYWSEELQVMRFSSEDLKKKKDIVKPVMVKELMDQGMSRKEAEAKADRDIKKLMDAAVLGEGVKPVDGATGSVTPTTAGNTKNGGFDFAGTQQNSALTVTAGGLKLSGDKAAAYLAGGKVAGFKLAILALRY